jgi:hypothetical protein
MSYIGYKPADKPLTSADITDSIITSAKITDGTIANADINSSAAIALSKLSTTGTASASNYLRGDGAWSTVSSDFVLLTTATASSVTTLDINGYFTSSYDVYKLFIYNLYQGSSSTNFNFRVATTGSYTVQTGSDYYGSHVYARRASDAGTLEHVGDWGASSMYCALGVGTTSSAVANAEITIFNPLSTSVKKKFNVHSNGIEGDITVSRSLIGTEYWNSTTAVTGLRFISSAGNNFTGTFKLYGIKN